MNIRHLRAFALFALPCFAVIGIAMYLVGPPMLAMPPIPFHDVAFTAGSGGVVVPLALFAGIALAWLFTECLGSLTVRRLAVAGILGAITAAALFTPLPAMAADTATDTSITIPWGTWLSSAAGALIEVMVAALVAVVTWLASKVSTPIASLLKTLLTEQLLSRAVTYGINAVAGAAHDKALSINVSNQVVRTAAQYALDHGPSWLIEWLGTPEEIAEMIIARLKLEPEASVSLTGTDVVGVTAETS